jgi:subtilase family serine protease
MEMENEDEGQASTFLTRVVVLFIQAAIIGVVGGLVATALIMIVRVGQ